MGWAFREASSALEGELQRVRSELRSSRAVEADLRGQLAAAAAARAEARSDAAAAKSRVDTLDTKLTNLVKVPCSSCECETERKEGLT